MEFLNLTDLHNPRNITSIWYKSGGIITIDSETQGFQECENRIEIWEKLPDGRLIRPFKTFKKNVNLVSFNNADWVILD